MRVEHGRTDDAWGRCCHEARGEGACGDALEAGDLGLDGLDVEVLELALAFRRVLLLAGVRYAAQEIRDEVRELLEFAPAAALGYPAEARHALRHIGLEADALLLAVVADVDASEPLPLDHMAHGVVHLGVELGLVIGLAGLAIDEE